MAEKTESVPINTKEYLQPTLFPSSASVWEWAVQLWESEFIFISPVLFYKVGSLTYLCISHPSTHSASQVLMPTYIILFQNSSILSLCPNTSIIGIDVLLTSLLNERDDDC